MLTDLALGYCVAIDNCQWTARSWVVLISLIVHTHTHTATGDRVYLSLKGTVYANNSAIHITEIGETNTGLQCITDRRPCCSAFGGRTGEWLFPNGTAVPIQDVSTSFYRTRGDDGTVNLNRRNNNIFMPTGLFCCEIPDALDIMQTLCVNISEQRQLLLATTIINGANCHVFQMSWFKLVSTSKSMKVLMTSASLSLVTPLADKLVVWFGREMVSCCTTPIL